MSTLRLTIGLLLILSCAGETQQPTTEEIAFDSGPFNIVGDLRLPGGNGPHPVVVFVHGDGPNNRTAGVTYPPIMQRMQRAGYATFAWDKPGTGESTGQIDRNRLFEQRTQIVLDAIEVLKGRPDIDIEQIGLWGISQAGYIMPLVLSKSDDIAFMIAVSCPGEAGYYQGLYLFTAQAVCAGLPEKDAAAVENLIDAASRAQTYEEYARQKSQLANYPVLGDMAFLGFRIGVAPEEEWHADDLEGDYFWDPMKVIERTTIPVLAFFGGKDTQADPIQGAKAYRAALERAGNQNFRIELIPGVDHNIILSETGCMEERERRPRSAWTNYAPEYLDTLEEWLGELRR
ncbi:MAG: alpha/beta fold hydrolase [Gemmatimonadota bacterium]|nr:MAG: alpha/beta fold hydrolase [Gemmatimonadota bacterium]